MFLMRLSFKAGEFLCVKFYTGKATQKAIITDIITEPIFEGVICLDEQSLLE